MRLLRTPSIVHAGMLVTTVFSILVAGRILSLVIPSEFYFTFQSLFSDRTPQNMMLALFGKMLAPALAGFGLGWFVYGRSAAPANPAHLSAAFARRLRMQWIPTFFLGGFFAAFLSAWPIIIYWDLLSNPEITHLKAVFLFLYMLYMLGYGYMALLGLLGAIFAREHLNGGAGATKLVSMGELTRVGALWLLNSGLASTAMEILTK
jgi:hypothetical protein